MIVRLEVKVADLAQAATVEGRLIDFMLSSTMLGYREPGCFRTFVDPQATLTITYVKGDQDAQELQGDKRGLPRLGDVYPQGDHTND